MHQGGDYTYLLLHAVRVGIYLLGQRGGNFQHIGKILYFFMEQNDVSLALEAVKAEFEKFVDQDAVFIFVTNEIGLGGVSPNKLQRQFTDLLGWANQYIASKADEVILMVSGIPVKIK